MLELFQSVPVSADVFLLAALAILLIIGFRGLCWPKTPRPNAHPTDRRYAHLLRK
jgi:hypothetical protein